MAGLARCVICCFAKSNIVEEKTDYLHSALSFYWQRAGVDMKPAESAKYDVCATCFDKIEELYEAHKARESMQAKLFRARKMLKDDFQKGIAKRIQQDIPLLNVHAKFQVLLKYESVTPSEQEEDID